MALPRSLVVAVAQAVERQGGDIQDVEDLLAVWERLVADKHGRAARLHHEAANPPCRCADGGDGEGDCCDRCYGVRPGMSR